MPPVSETDMQLVHESPGKLLQADCLCPICLEIFLEPVTLPCKHTFCKPCFLETVDKANMCCPLCRKRVSSWARLNSRNKTLVNMELWRRIQEAFPAQCQRRLNGAEDEDNINALIPKPRVSRPGEVRQEYEDQISKFVEEKRALEEAERKASEEYIQRLLAEEEQRVVQERRRQEERLEEDERLARMLNKELNPSQVLESHSSATSAKEKKSTTGLIEKFLCPVPYGQPHCETSTTTTFLANKETIQNAPSTLVPCTAEPRSLETPASNSCATPCNSNSDPDPHEQLSPTAESSNFSKRKMGDAELATGAEQHKRLCSSPRGGLTLQDLALQEEALWRRWQQEEEDRQLALRLQRELDRENAVDRRKGSADSYLLRKKTCSSSSDPGGESSRSAPPAAECVSRWRAGADKAEKRVSTASAQPERKKAKERQTSTHSAPPSAQRGATQRQTTLTDMFNSLGS